MGGLLAAIERMVYPLILGIDWMAKGNIIIKVYKGGTLVTVAEPPYSSVTETVRPQWLDPSALYREAEVEEIVTDLKRVMWRTFSDLVQMPGVKKLG